MATPLYLLSTASDVNPGAENELTLGFARGGGSANATCATTAGGTNIQLQYASTNCCWISPPLQGVTISGTITLNIRISENNNKANCGCRVLIQRCDGTGAVISTISDTSYGSPTEMNAPGDAALNWTATPTSRTLSQGDRIKVTVFAINVGTMATGYTVTETFNGANAGSAGDSYVQFFETVAAYVTTQIKAVAGLADASVKAVSGLAIASVHAVSGLT